MIEPHRGDDVEQWIKSNRDMYPHYTDKWYVLDDLLDEYRLHADTGTSLAYHVSETQQLLVERMELIT